MFFFFKQKTAYEMRISDWSSDVCSSDLTAYPQLADNPLHHLARMLNALVSEPLDGGNAHFPPSSLQLTSVDVGNATTNVIPAKATALFNVRFNDIHSSGPVESWIRERLEDRQSTRLNSSH